MARHEQAGCKRAEIDGLRDQPGPHTGCHRPRPWGGGALAQLRRSDRGRTCAPCRHRRGTARGQVVSAPAAALPWRRRVAPQSPGAGDGGDRRCRRQHGLVHGPGRRLRDVGGVPEARSCAAPVRTRRRGARLGRRAARQGHGRGRRLSRHRQMELRQRLRQRHAAWRPQPRVREGRHAPQACRRQPPRAQHAFRQVQGDHPRHVVHARPQGHGKLHIRGAGPVRARGGDGRPRRAQRGCRAGHSLPVSPTLTPMHRPSAR